MRSQRLKRRVKIAGVALLVLALLTTTALAFNAHHTVVQASTTRHGSVKAGTPFQITRMSSVDWSKLPVATRSASGPSRQQAFKDPYPLTPAQQSAYLQALKQHKIIPPQAKAEPLPVAGPSAAQIAQNAANSTNPNFDACGYQVLPCPTHSFSGENYLLQGINLPGVALASNPSYVMEGTNGGISVYNFNGTTAYGPIHSYAFFASILHNSYYLLGSPRMFWDATREHWIIIEEEFDIDNQGNTSSYFDIAISKGQNVNLIPNQWYLYQFSTDVNLTGVSNLCDPDTDEYSFGSDYWGLWLSCGAYHQIPNANPTFLGNVVFALNKNALYSGTTLTVVDYTQIPTGISCGTSCLQPAAYLTPAIEDGTPDAEFLLANDLNSASPNANSDLTTVAFTNTRALATGGIPSATYVINTLPISYTYPIEAAQPSTPKNSKNPLFPGIGTNQVEYKGGNLYFAMTTTINTGSDDGVYWAEVQPQLTPLDPTHPQNQTASNTLIRQASIFAFPTGTDAYLPSIIGSSEDDVVLVFNMSSATVYSSIVYTGRRATDAPNIMGGNAGTVASIIQGTWSIDPGNLGTYSSCSLDTNLTSRGLIWCGGAYPGPANANTGWTDQIYALQV